MWNPEENWAAQTSFVSPVAPPSVDPTAAPLVCVQFAAAWQPYVIGALLQLIQPAAWAVPDAATLQATLQRAQDLIEAFGTAGACPVPIQFRCDPATNQPEYSTDGGATWTPFSLCYIGPSGPNGSILIEPGPPANPLGLSAANEACSIAAYLATQIIQASLQTVLSQIQAANTVMGTVRTLLGLAAFIDVPLALLLQAGAVLYTVIQAANQADIQAGLNDAALWHNIECAIYLQIVATGYVTAANYEAIDTAIDGVAFTNAATQSAITGYVENLGATGLMWLQEQGPLFTGDCSTCVPPPIGCAPFRPDIIGTNTSYSTTAPNPGQLTIGAVFEYSGVASDVAMDQTRSFKLICTAAPGNYVALGFYQVMIDGGPNGGNNAWKNNVDIAATLDNRGNPITLYLDSFGGNLFTHTYPPQTRLWLRWNHVTAQWELYLPDVQAGPLFVYAGALRQYKPVVYGVLIGDVISGIELCYDT